jgi:ferric-dicitrate binding protein FerR (iron transport regulator)
MATGNGKGPRPRKGRKTAMTGLAAIALLAAMLGIALWWSAGTDEPLAVPGTVTDTLEEDAAAPD